ncbi:lipopolysaccharide biosynthesis protein [Methanosarcina sp.]|uniref:lipopolysaccharide biosynthesis protein n=1 Tax=Methanosarcina sp. TaxID=2213 RepID=UPI00261A4B0F|nr:flippase [Methanosarcina sp.]
MIINDIKRLAKNSLGFAIGTILTQAIGFFLLPIYTRYLTPADYGILSIASVVSSVLVIFLIFGQGGAIGRFYYDYHHDSTKLRDYLSTICLSVCLISFAICVILCLLGDSFFSIVLSDIPFNPYLILVIWSAFLGVPLNFALILLQVRERAHTYSVINVAKFLISTILIIFFVVMQREGALGSLKGQFVCSIIFFFVALSYLKKDITIKFDRNKFKESFYFGLPLIPHMLAGWITSLIDRLFLSWYWNLSIVGLYSLGYQIGSILSLITTAINFAWVPFFLSKATDEGEKAKHTFSILTTYYMALIGFIGVGIALFAKDVIHLMTVPAYYEASQVVPFIVLAFVLNGMYYMVVNQIFLLKKTKYLAITTFLGALINIGLNFLLIPEYGMIGAAAATAMTYLFTFIGVFLLSNRLFPIKYEYLRISKILFVGISVYAISLFLPEYDILCDIALRCLVILVYPTGLLLIHVFTDEEITQGKIYTGEIMRGRFKKKNV